MGPCFPSGTKAFETFAPQAFLEAVVNEAELPAFAIGGIEPQRIAQLRALGLSRVAVASAVTRADDPAAAVASLLAALSDAS